MEAYIYDKTVNQIKSYVSSSIDRHKPAVVEKYFNK